jgi:hypothetical protein
MIRMTPRYFILPILALIVIGSLPAPADSGPTAGISGSCGPALSTIVDPALKSSFDNLERTQSAAAAKICAIYRNSMSVTR